MFGTIGDAGDEAGTSAAASAASATSSTRSSAGPRPGTRRGHPLAGSDLRYDLRITLEEAVQGVEKEIEFSVLGRCETCSGSGAKPGTEPVTCDQCGGRGEIRSTRRTMLGQMVNVTTCPKCQGEGKIITEPVRDVPRRRPDRAQADAPGHDPGRHRRGPPDPALERGRGRAARRAARQPLRRGPRHAPSDAPARGHGARLRRRHLDRPGGARHADHASRRSTARRRSRSRPAPSPAPRSGCAAAACRTSAGPGRAATSTSSSTSSSRRSSRSASASCSTEYAAETGESVAPNGGGIREKLGLG